MYRILKADKDSYICNKIIQSSRPALSSSIDSNVGQAGTIDLYKLYNETSPTSGIELSRGLIHFNLDPLRALTGSILNPSDPSFKCFLNLKNVYGGQPVPSNYTLSVFPLAKDWAEGRGNDVVAYRDLDAVNWLTASNDFVTFVTPYPTIEYEEAVVNVPTLINQITVPFYHPFSSVPTVVITDISSSNNAIVNAFVDHATSISNLLISFSAPFIGSFVYRAAYDPTPATPKTVVRAPRFPSQYANVELQSIVVSGSNRFTSSFADFGGVPTSAYATFYENFNNNLANVYVAVTGATTTSIDGVFSTTLDAQLNLMGFRGADTYQKLNSWTSGGADYHGIAGTANADYYDSILLYTGYLPLEFTQAFYRGDEDLNVEVTPAIKLMLAGDLPDYGFRLSFTGSQETDSFTRFVKRFSTRQSRNTNLHPSLVVKYDDTFVDNQSNLYFDYPNKVGTYFAPFGYPTNFQNNDGSFVSGSGSLMLELHGSQSQYVTTSSFSISHNKVISYLSASWVYFSTSFTGSQIKRGGLFETGSYYADVYLPKSAAGLSGVLDSSGRATLTPIWKSTDGAIIFDTGAPLTFQPLASKNNIGSARNYATNITNLKDVYISTDVARMRVFVMDYDPTLASFYLPYMSTSKIFKESYWRVIDPYTKEVLIPFDIETKGTKMSVDGEGMYFDLYMEDLPVNRPLEIEILLKDFGTDYFVEKQGFLFKVIKS